jgi:hypothetical protein
MNAKIDIKPTKLNKKEALEKRRLTGIQLLKNYRVLIVLEANNIRV